LKPAKSSINPESKDKKMDSHKKLNRSVTV